MSTVYLIRHGSTVANERRLYCGSTDLPLSEQGAAALAQLRSGYPPLEHCRFVTTGMQRTEQTLRILFGEVPHTREARLREMDFGKFEMRSYEELKEDGAYQRWITGDNETNAAPGGESGAQMRQRVLEAFAQLLAQGRDTVLVTHGGVIAAIMEHWFPGEGKTRYQWQPEPGCGYAVTDGGYRNLP